jgi:hypothetical protein
MNSRVRCGALLLASAATLLAGCSGGASDGQSGAASQDVTSVPPAYLPSFVAALDWMNWLEQNYSDWYTTSPRSDADARPWGDGFQPRTDPVFSHNALEIEGVTPHDVLALMQAGRSDEYYANSSAATDCVTGEDVTLTLGRQYCWTTFGTVQVMRIVELADEPQEAVIAWQGGSLGVEVYHRWMMRPTTRGTLVITEEIERGVLPLLSFYNSKMNPALRAGHELWLHGMQSTFAKP